MACIVGVVWALGCAYGGNFWFAHDESRDPENR